MTFDRGQPVQVRFGPRTLEGYVDDVRIKACFGAGTREEIIIDTGAATIAASPSKISLI